MQTYIAYTRVSSAKQSTGASLQEQRCAIERYTRERGLSITHWYEEVQTAAKRGRPVFREVVQHLARRKGTGLILHKVDRGVRNLRDWADLGELIDHGVDIRFAHDDLDLETRGGRLTADIQAVIAADYIRNLREEIRKGVHGRLAQGLYPMKAPIGYRDRGRGRAKMADPVVAPLIICAFRLYATGGYTLRALAAEEAAIASLNVLGRIAHLRSMARDDLLPFALIGVGERIAGRCVLLPPGNSGGVYLANLASFPSRPSVRSPKNALDRLLQSQRRSRLN